MKSRFLCKKHDVYLKGWPLWDLVSSGELEPDTYSVSFRDMHCPENPGNAILNKCNDSNWEIETE